MRYSLHQYPLSTYGSAMAVSCLPERICKGHASLRMIRGSFDEQEQYLFEMLSENGDELSYETFADSGQAELIGDGMHVRCCFTDEQTLHLLGEGAGALQMTKAPYGGSACVVPQAENRYILIGMLSSLMLTMRRGGARFDANGVVKLYPDADGAIECYLQAFDVTPPPMPMFLDFDHDAEQARARFDAFAQHFPKVEAQYAEAAELALYTLWSAVAYIADRPAVLMSKNYMNFLWSWDFTFNALALAYGEPELAWAQYLLMAETQDKDGAYPDHINENVACRVYVKPPVYGLMLRRLLAVARPGREILERVYRSIARNTDWWMSNRATLDGLPEYRHGFDSGWDNSTVFRCGVPVQSPDLSAFLIVQMRALAETAWELSLPDETACWLRRAEDLKHRLLTYLVQDERLIARHVSSGEAVENQSLLMYIPLVLGNELPEPLLHSLVKGLLEPGAFMSQYGLATERIDSPLYAEDSYWRGPMWPPSTDLLAYALQRIGMENDAQMIKDAYLRVCCQSGFSENYSTLNGQALRDPAYTWSASVFLAMLYESSIKGE